MDDVLKEALETWKETVTEAYEVVKTIEVVVKGQPYRLDVIEAHGTGMFKGRKSYDVKGWRYTQNKGELGRYLTSQEIAGLSEQNPERALYRAISYLATGTI